MDGKEIAKFIDSEIEKRGLKKKSFYEATKISSATLSQWRTGTYNPSDENIKQVETFFGVKITSKIDEIKKDPSVMSDEEVDAELYEILSALKDRPELRALFRAAQGTDADNVRRVADMLEGFKNGGHR